MSRPKLNRFTLEAYGAKISIEHSGLHRLTDDEFRRIWEAVEFNIIGKPRVDPAFVKSPMRDMLEQDAAEGTL